MAINQAVIFTKPVHHLNIDLTPEQLDQQTRVFFDAKGFKVVFSKWATGAELAEREIIRQHYLMYSKASYGKAHVTEEGKAKFSSVFGKDWDAEVDAGRIMGNPELMKVKGIGTRELFDLWNGAAVQKIQAGLLMTKLDKLDCYCINAFYPDMEYNFYHPATRIDYYVVEFDSTQVSWGLFRKEILGVTNAAKAVPESFRGMLYAKYKVEFPGRDNFVHGSAGPLEGMVERSIHETNFVMVTSPIGKYLTTLGVSLERFKEWKVRQSIADLGAIFDATEEKDTDDVFPILDGVAW